MDPSIGTAQARIYSTGEENRREQAMAAALFWADFPLFLWGLGYSRG